MSKKARSEANKIAMAIKANKAEYYVADVDLGDDAEDVSAAAVAVGKILGKVKSNFILISADVKYLIVVVEMSDFSKITAKDWLLESLTGISEALIVENLVSTSDSSAKICLELDTPFKYKDIIRTSAFSYLHKLDLLQEKSEEEEYLDF